jgi:hypothetical protein
MPRSILLPTTSALAALTALALLAAALAVRPPEPVALDGAAEASSRAVVRRFYETVNAVIATGDAAPLAAVLAPDYAEADGTGVLVPGREALDRSLRTLHEIAPDLRLDAADLVGDGDRVAAVVSTRGAERATALGLPLISPVLWGSVDIFRVTDGRIAARMGAAERGTQLEPGAVEVPLDLPLPSARVATVQRLSFEPAASLSAPAVDGPRVLAVEAGALAVAAAGIVPSGDAQSGDAANLAAGEWLVLPTGAAYEARNAGREPAVLLEVLATASTALPGKADGRAEGVTTPVLAGGLLTPVPTGQATLMTGRLTLAPGAGLAWSGPVGVTMLAVEAGTLELATEGAPAWVRSAPDGSGESRRSTTLAAGDGARVGTGTGAELRNAGEEPVAVTVVTLLVPAAEAPPSLPPPPPTPVPTTDAGVLVDGAFQFPTPSPTPIALRRDEPTVPASSDPPSWSDVRPDHVPN